MSLLFALALLLQDKPAAPGAAEELQISAEKLEALAAEVRPIVEKATGRAFKEFPKVVLSSPETVRDALVDELGPQIAAQVAGLKPEERRGAVRNMAEMLSQHLFAKCQASGKRVHVIAANFGKLSKLLHRPVFLTPEFLRLIVIHELVHSLDEQEYRALSRFADLKSGEEINTWNALVEGHAQHVTRAILAAEKREKLFAEYEEALQADPPGASEGEKLLTQIVSLYFRFPYLEGCKFFNALAAAGKKTYVDDVFTKPPASIDVILHPERYYDPKSLPVARDLTALLDELTKKRPDWTSRKQKIGELEIRSSFGDFVDKKEVGEAATRVIGGQALVLAAEGGSRMIIFLVVQMDGAASASKLSDLMAKLSRAKEERMKEGVIRITKANRAALKTTGGAKTELTRMTVQVGGQTVQTADAIAAVDEWLIEIMHSNQEATDEEIAAHLNQIVAFLKGGK